MIIIIILRPPKIPYVLNRCCPDLTNSAINQRENQGSSGRCNQSAWGGVDLSPPTHPTQGFIRKKTMKECKFVMAHMMTMKNDFEKPEILMKYDH